MSFYLSGSVFLRHRSSSEEVNVGKRFMFWNGRTCSAAFPQAMAVLMHVSACKWMSVLRVFVRALLISRAESSTSNHEVKHKTSFYHKSSGISRQFPCGPKPALCAKYIHAYTVCETNWPQYLWELGPPPFSLCYFHIFPSDCHLSSPLVSFISLFLAAVLLSLFPSLSVSPFFLSGRMV